MELRSSVPPSNQTARYGLAIEGRRWIAACASAALLAPTAQAQIVAWGSRGFTLQETRARIVAVSVGGDHALALREDGLLESWGINTYGQALVPETMTEVRAIATGGAHAIAVRTNGTIHCWGLNTSGQCTPPGDLQSPTMVAAGGAHSLALRPKGTVAGWGLNANGQIDVPADLTSVIAIAASSNHSVAVTASGSVVCWGDNTYGQCDAPKRAVGVVQASTGGSHVATRLANGQVICWGLNNNGQCDVPASLPPIAQIAGGTAHTVALDNQGNVHCWGLNSSLQCSVPPALPDASLVAAGVTFSLAVSTSGTLETWGRTASAGAGDYPERMRSVVSATGSSTGIVGIDARGRAVGWGFGTGSIPTFPIPPDLANVRVISSGLYLTLAVEWSGRVRCWGNNSYGQLDVPSGIPAVVDGAALAQACVALLQNGEVVAWGSQSGFSTPLAPAPASVGVIRDLDAGLFFAAAINTDDRVSVWGGNLPPPADLGPVSDIACGASHVVALLPDGRVRCWGSNADGQCNVPPSIRNARAIDAGWSTASSGNSCTTVVLQDGSIQCFGASGLCPPVTSQPFVLAAPGRANQTNSSNCIGLLIPDRDCNANGVRDSLELDGHDCNGNGLHDACDVAFGVLEDCNGNGLGDECEKATFVSRGSGELGPIGVNAPVSWSVADALPSATTVVLRVRAHGDFSGSLERVELRLGSSSLGNHLASTADCFDTDWVTIEIEPDAFNAEIPPSGDLPITATASVGVDPDRCAEGTWIEFELEYVSSAPADCNANGLLDSCEIAEGLATDANGNGIIDACESGLGSCPADIDRSGEIDAADLSLLLDAWGDTAGPADIDGDGLVAASDLSLLLAAWGACPSK